MLDALWDYLGLPNEEETEVGEGSPLDVIIDIRHSEVKQLLNSHVVRSACIGATDGVHGTIPDDVVLGAAHLLDQCFGLLLLAVHLEGQAH